MNDPIPQNLANAAWAFATAAWSDADALLELVTFSEPARVEEYTSRIMKWPVDGDGVMPMVEDREAVQADHDAAKREALTGIGHCIFS